MIDALAPLLILIVAFVGLCTIVGAKSVPGRLGKIVLSSIGKQLKALFRWLNTKAFPWFARLVRLQWRVWRRRRNQQRNP